MTKQKKKIFNIQDCRRIIKKTYIAGACFLAVFAMILLCSSAKPYIINVGDTKIYVENKKTARVVMSEVVRQNLPQNAEAQGLVKTKNISITQGFGATILTKDEAVKAVQDALTNNASITFVCEREETVETKPKTKYIKDETMFAGESEVVQEGEAGQKVLLNQYTIENGQIIDTLTLKEEVIKKSVPKKIKKGILGLPEDADWKTYSGQPIFKDGDDLVKISLKYLGAPYKYGGKSLKTGIDCVQFIRQMYAKLGIKLPNGKYGLQKAGISVSYKDAMPGDIICYSGHHYAIYMGNGKIVHASSKGGVSTRNDAHYRKIVSIRRVIH